MVYFFNELDHEGAFTSDLFAHPYCCENYLTLTDSLSHECAPFMCSIYCKQAFRQLLNYTPGKQDCYELMPLVASIGFTFCKNKTPSNIGICSESVFKISQELIFITAVLVIPHRQLFLGIYGNCSKHSHV